MTNLVSTKFSFWQKRRHSKINKLFANRKVSITYEIKHLLYAVEQFIIDVFVKSNLTHLPVLTLDSQIGLLQARQDDGAFELL